MPRIAIISGFSLCALLMTPSTAAPRQDGSTKGSLERKPMDLEAQKASKAPSTQKLLSDYAKTGSSESNANVWPLETFLTQNVNPRATLESVEVKLAGAWKIPLPAAQKLLRAYLLQESDQFSNDSPFHAEVAALFNETLSEAPTNRQVRIYAMRYFAGRPWNGIQDIQKITSLTLESPAPAQTALDLADYTDGPSVEAALTAAMHTDPENPLLYLKASDYASKEGDPAFAAALAGRSYERLAKNQPGSVDLIGAAAGKWVCELIRAGDTALAVKTWSGFPPAVQTSALGAGAGLDKATLGGSECVVVALGEIRPTLALALIMEGKKDEALDLIAPLLGSTGSPLTGAKASADGRPDTATLQTQILRFILVPTGADPFDLIVDLIGDEWGSNTGLTKNLAWQRTVLTWASREGYAEAVQGSLFYSTKWLTDLTSTVSDKGRPWPEDLVAEARQHRPKLDLPKPDTPPTDSSSEGSRLPADPMAPRLKELLARPRLTPFKEQPLPPGMTVMKVEEEGASDRTKKLFKQLKIPDAFEPVRAEVNGNEVVAIGVSQNLDPVGEVSPGGYWVLRSHDRGKTWNQPLYTGLQVYRPYVVKPDSQLPMLAGDHLHLEVALRELDDASITFPPLGLRVKRSQDGLFLDFPWPELEKDSDGDGLTDLVEEKLLTDPNSKDTDGDGIEDGQDPLPQIPNKLQTDPTEASALAAVLEKICLRESPAIVTGLSNSKESLETALKRIMTPKFKVRLSVQRAIFICGQRRSFSGLAPADRIVVITPEELDLMRKKFSLLYPMQLSPFFFDRERRRAYCVWSASWTGGALRLTWTGAGWSVEVVSSWIT